MPALTTAIDLSEVLFRIYEIGDIDSPKQASSLAITSTTLILLSSIKFRAFQNENSEEE